MPLSRICLVLMSTLVLLPLLSPSPPAQSKNSGVTRPLGAGTVNWSSGTLRVTGSGAPPDRGSEAQKKLMAKRAATTDAYRQLAEAVNGVQVFSQTTVRNFVTESDVVRIQVSAVIRGAQPVGQARYLADGSVEVDVEMPLFGSGSLAQGLDFGSAMQKQMNQPYSQLGQRLAFSGPAIALSLFPAAPTPQLRGQRIAQAGGYTGLVVDATGLGAEPALGPFLIGAAKRLHPNSEIGIDPGLIVQKGPVHYVEDLDAAKEDTDRVGNNPLIISAKGAKGHPTSTDILLDDSTARQVLEANQQGHFLEALKVTLVI